MCPPKNSRLLCWSKFVTYILMKQIHFLRKYMSLGTTTHLKECYFPSRNSYKIQQFICNVVCTLHLQTVCCISCHFHVLINNLHTIYPLFVNISDFGGANTGCQYHSNLTLLNWIWQWLEQYQIILDLDNGNNMLECHRRPELMKYEGRDIPQIEKNQYFLWL